MKTPLALPLASLPLAGLLLAACAPTFAQTQPTTITVDEMGVGSVQRNGNSVPISGFLTTDPGPGGLVGAQPNVLAYHLPFAGTPGDVLLLDGSQDNAPGDLLRFNGNAGVLFYSDSADGVDARADLAPFPTAFYTNVVRISEIGPDNSNGASYTPLPGQPGFDPAASTTYQIVSDAPVPEASSGIGFGLILCLAGLTVGLRRYKTRQA